MTNLGIWTPFWGT